jgi:hypothetical protein
VKVSALSSSFDGGQETVSFSITCTLVNAGSMFPQDPVPAEQPEESESQVTVLDE